MKNFELIEKDFIRIERAIAVNISGGINGCCIIDVGNKIAQVLTKVMGTNQFRVSEEEKFKMTLREFSNIIIGNMGILLSNNYGIHIHLSPPVFLVNRKLSRRNSRIQTINIPLLIYGKKVNYNISILRKLNEDFKSY